MNITFSSLALCSPSSVVICLHKGGRETHKEQKEELEMARSELLLPIQEGTAHLRTLKPSLPPGVSVWGETTSGKLPREHLELWQTSSTG